MHYIVLCKDGRRFSNKHIIPRRLVEVTENAFDGARERKASKSACASLRYRNWVRKGNESGFDNASGTTGTSDKDSEVVGEGVDSASTGRLAQ